VQQHAYMAAVAIIEIDQRMAPAAKFGSSSSSAPGDTWHAAWLIFFLQGIGQLFPWNAFISASAYFSTRFCGTRYASSFENWFGLGYNIAAVLGLLLALRCQGCVSQRRQIQSGLAAAFAVFLACALLVGNTSISGNALFSVTMSLISISAVAVAFVQSGLFGLASAFPPACTQAMMAGQGLAGLVVALASLLTTVSGPGAPLPADCTAATEGTANTTATTAAAAAACAPYVVDSSTAAYFGVATGTLAACAVAFVLLERLPYSKHCLAVLAQRAPTAAAAAASAQRNGGYDLVSPLNGGFSDYEDDDTTDSTIYSSTSSSSNSRKWYSPPAAAAAALTSVRPLAYSVCAVFAVTLAVFPSTTAKIRSQSSCDPAAPRFRRDLFTPFAFVVFNAADLGGRCLSGVQYSWLQLRKGALPVFTVARLAFIPLLLLCRVDGSRLGTLLHNDAWPIMLVLLFGLSNGYLSSKCMMAGPACAPPALKETAGTVMVLFLSLGLLLGSLLSFLVLLISTGSAS
jgi:solute carrier family 29 (equilibrative nucleoside transporter), member 1/2/3